MFYGKLIGGLLGLLVGGAIRTGATSLANDIQAELEAVQVAPAE